MSVRHLVCDHPPGTLTRGKDRTFQIDAECAFDLFFGDVGCQPASVNSCIRYYRIDCTERLLCCIETGNDICFTHDIHLYCTRAIADFAGECFQFVDPARA